MVVLVLLLLVSQIGVATAKSQLASPIHIFLSFRGDVRDNFACLLYDALFREGFNVFMDDECIRTGQVIDLEIQKAINNSMGAVIIFSNNFASSEWCLNELVLILGRKSELGSGYVLEPVYVNGVQPEDLLDQRGSYGKALAKHENKYWFWFWNWEWNNKVKAWRAALEQVTGLRGKILSGKWNIFINEIVEEIRQEFSIMGITMNPRRPNPTEIDHHACCFCNPHESIKKLVQQQQQQQPHDQFVQLHASSNINTTTTTVKFMKGSGVWGGLCSYWRCAGALFLTICTWRSKRRSIH